MSQGSFHLSSLQKGLVESLVGQTFAFLGCSLQGVLKGLKGTRGVG